MAWMESEEKGWPSEAEELEHCWHGLGMPECTDKEKAPVASAPSLPKPVQQIAASTGPPQISDDGSAEDPPAYVATPQTHSERLVRAH